MKRRILFLQLPLLDNDTAMPRENYPFAALWLAHALACHRENAHWQVMTALPEWDDLDNRSLLERISSSGAAAVAFTLYLWNVERNLAIAARLRALHPEIRLIAGGPEVAPGHPLLTAEPVFDALVIGEGEAVFPEILNGIRTRRMPDAENVLTPGRDRWKPGRQPVSPVDLALAQVPVAQMHRCIARRPAVYIETSRGCSLTCTYCRYHHLQKGVRTLPPAAAARRVNALRAAGAREIRFVDPTFNSRADFTLLLRKLARVNAARKVPLFAELRADTLTAEQAELMVAAGFAEVEVGVQSTDPEVLRAIRRPANIAQIENGIRRLTGAGIKVTLDLMYGLPKQTVDDVIRSIEWGRRLGPGVQIQCMQTLLLPGTDLRRQSERYGLCALPLPPYGVLSTATMSERDIAEIELLLHESGDLPSDPVTARFTGYRLSGLFREQCAVDVRRLADPAFAPPGTNNRRALLIQGGDLNTHRNEICRLLDRAVRAEPDMLWQFVLCAEREEPPELLQAMIRTLRRQPSHLLDRYASARSFGLMAARRIFVRLREGRKYSPSWRARTEELLCRHFM